ncbi:MAG: type II secretion system protein, partial [Fimbriimonadales bacterium]
QGKTLLELLTVVAIIALLVALIIPVALWVRHHAKRSSCASNLRQLYVALQSYVEDYKGPPPFATHTGGGRFIYDLEVLTLYRPAIRPLLICPIDTYQGEKTPQGIPQPFPTSYYLHYIRPLPLLHPDPEVVKMHEWFETIDPNNPEEVFITCLWHSTDNRLWAVFADGHIGWANIRYCEVDGRRFAYYRPFELTEEQCRKLFVDVDVISP